MKALSVKQPYAHEIALGLKKLELRTWKTAYRGDLLICASKYDPGLWVDVELEGKTYPLPLPCGVQMCVVCVSDVRQMTRADARESGIKYAPGMYAWVLTDPRPVLPAPVVGALNLFTVDEKFITKMPKGDSWLDYDYPNRRKTPPKAWAE